MINFNGPQFANSNFERESLDDIQERAAFHLRVAKAAQADKPRYTAHEPNNGQAADFTR